MTHELNLMALENKYVWFFSYSGNRLHYVHTGADIDEFWEKACSADDSTRVPAICGITSEWVSPGIFSRMGMPRCQRCCERTGIPYGEGTPVNSKDQILAELEFIK